MTPQTIWSLGDVALVTATGGLELRSKTDVLISIPNAMVGKHWYSILVTCGEGELSIDLKRLDGKVAANRIARTATTIAVTSDLLILAASGIGPSGSPLLPFNGKIDSPTLHLKKPTPETIAAWQKGKTPRAAAWAEWKVGEDFAAETMQGRLINGVERAVTGRNWDGRSDSFTEAPLQYCALQFHDDDMVDAGWSMTSNSHCLIRSRAASMPSGSQPAEASPTFLCSCGQSREQRRRFCFWSPPTRT